MKIDIKCYRQSTLNLLLKFQKTQIDEKYNPFVLLLIYSKQIFLCHKLVCHVCLHSSD